MISLRRGNRTVHSDSSKRNPAPSVGVCLAPAFHCTRGPVPSSATQPSGLEPTVNARTRFASTLVPARINSHCVNPPSFWFTK
jgi:hypothetical protein